MQNASFQIIRNLSFGVIARGWSQVTTLVLAILSARVLGKEDFGIYTVSTVFVVILQGLMYGGIYDYIIKSRSEFVEKDTCFWMNFCFSVVGAFIIIALAPFVSFASGSPLILPLMVTLAPSALIASFTSWQEALLLREARLSSYYITCIVTETLALGIALSALFSGFGVWSLVVNRYAEITLKSLVYFFILKKLPRLYVNTVEARTILKFSSYIYLSAVISQLSSRSADLLIGVLAGPAAAGSFRLGSRIVSGLSEVVFQPAITMAWVQFSDANHEVQKIKQEWHKLTIFISVTVWPLLAVLAYTGKSVIHVLVGSGWDEAVPVLVVLAVERGLSVTGCLVGPLLGVCNRTGVILKLSVASGIGTVVAMSLFARYGSLSAALGQFLISVVMFVAGIIIVFYTTKIRIREFLNTIIPGSISTIAVLFVIIFVEFFLGLPTSPIAQVCTTIVYATVAWLGALLFLRLGEGAVNARTTLGP